MHTVLCTTLSTLIFRGIGNAPTFYGLLRHASRKAREQYGKKIAAAYPGVVEVRQSLILCVTKYLVVRLSKRCARVHVGKWRLRTVGWFMLGCVAFSAYCHTGRAYKWKITGSCVKRAALDLAAVALCIDWRVGES